MALVDVYTICCMFIFIHIGYIVFFVDFFCFLLYTQSTEITYGFPGDLPASAWQIKGKSGEIPVRTGRCNHGVLSIVHCVSDVRRQSVHGNVESENLPGSRGKSSCNSCFRINKGCVFFLLSFYGVKMRAAQTGAPYFFVWNFWGGI